MMNNAFKIETIIDNSLPKSVYSSIYQGIIYKFNFYQTFYKVSTNSLQTFY